MVDIEVKSRDSRIVGGKLHLECIVSIKGEELLRETSSEYGRSRDDVIQLVEKFVQSLRSGLIKSGIQSRIIRSKF
ncbi:hypothetical protein BJD49_gp017 [Acinetobacter phage vB_AbaM_phiAbaA1]|uniref:hypothetical protein n=1 Tax=Acinetobacter phage vB_AbaM_phiAbaA1 TaxID=1605379 RepID=UPI00078BAA44|nr:hypothetical protein BJD49_gp017 [Acinetobacter phage vB_AbaM_phiAbaA1]AJK27120.1 hypothetical protein phiAbaA1_017 [Acinetobacter phage vB_AbaM_phiAbaA1]